MSNVAEGHRFTERRQVRTDDGTLLNAFSYGSPTNPPAALVNAFGMPARFWEPMRSALGDRFFLVTWESRGLPALDGPFDPSRCGLEQHATDMRDVLRSYGLAQVFVIAWCSGCQVTLRYAALGESGLLGAALLSGEYRLPDEFILSEHGRKLRLLLPYCVRSVAEARTYSDLLTSGSRATQDGRETSDGLSDDIVEMTGAPFRSGEALYRYAWMQKRYMEGPLHGWVSTATFPALVVGGAQDQVINPRASPEIARRLPDAELVMRPSGDHFLHYRDQAIPSLVDEFHSRRIGRAVYT